MSILIAPHNDDEGLFATFILLRSNPKVDKVLVVTDGVIHKKKFGIAPSTRRKESIKAMEHLGTPVEFLGLSDASMTQYELEEALKKVNLGGGIVWAPALEGGHPQHDMVHEAATKIFANVSYYHTYTKDNLSPHGGQIEIVPTDAEIKIKENVLREYTSQRKINYPHFEAVEKGQSEYISWR